MNVNDYFKYKKRVVVKIGSSSLQHPQTGSMNLMKIEKLVRELCDLRNQGMDVCLVSSGAIAVGRQAIGLQNRPEDISTKQACAAGRRVNFQNTLYRLLDWVHCRLSMKMIPYPLMRCILVTMIHSLLS